MDSAIRSEIDSLAEGDDKSRLLARTLQVQERYKKVIQRVYRFNSRLFLEHTNSVYIIKKDGQKTLIVYMDESIYAAELNAQRELIRLHMHQMFGEDVQVFEIKVSRRDYKKKHPYIDQSDTAEESLLVRDRCDERLSADKEKFISDTLSAVDDPRLRESLEKAMIADLKRQKEKK